MRLGFRLPRGDERRFALLAEEHGFFGVLVDCERSGEEAVVAGEVCAITTDLVVGVRVPLGHEHPLTLAEEIAVLDNCSGGRVLALADTGRLDAEAATEDVALLRACLSARPVQHNGTRRRVPAGIPGQAGPDRVAVTPEPAQVEVPVWLTGGAAVAIGAATGLPVVAGATGEVAAAAPVAPAVATLAGDADADRAAVLAWAGAGATHLILACPAGGGASTSSRGKSGIATSGTR